MRGEGYWKKTLACSVDNGVRQKQGVAGSCYYSTAVANPPTILVATARALRRPVRGSALLMVGKRGMWSNSMLSIYGSSASRRGKHSAVVPRFAVCSNVFALIFDNCAF